MSNCYIGYMVNNKTNLDPMFSLFFFMAAFASFIEPNSTFALPLGLTIYTYKRGK